MTSIAKNNAFGAGSPSWNLSFPEGNLTAAEILAYLPHWLKSVDVINRFVSHGGRSVTITYLLGKLRVMPSGSFNANSATIMMQYAMRRAGYKEWTVGTRHEFSLDREYDENSLYVGDFRPPRLTHPKSASTTKCASTNKQKYKTVDLTRNWAAEPVPFKDLALHVRQHPSGDDALDLTRCVRFALNHPDEKWLFPTDFEKLVKHIGGPLPVTHSHLDKQLFARYDDKFKAHTATRAPAKYNKKPNSKPKAKPKTKSKSKKAIQEDSTNTTTTKKKVMRQTRDSVRAASPTGSKRTIDEVGEAADNGGSKRRSSRRIKKAPVYVVKDEDTTDGETFDYSTPDKERKLSRIPPTPKDEESDFEAKEEPESDDELVAVDEPAADDSDFGTPSAVRGQRSAAHRARQTIQEQYSAALMEQFRASAAAAKPAHTFTMDHSPEMMATARAYEHRQPVFLTPPVLSANRMVIDPYTVHLYAQDGCRNEDELWASALSTYRFGGPRRSSPFRELYRLTEPMAWDDTDWAENIRWAKEQYRAFGVTTWTEYDWHLETIQEWRYKTMWVSEEAIKAGM